MNQTLSPETEAAISRVRQATRADESELMDLCRELYEENGLADIMSEYKVRAMMDRAFNREGAMIGVISNPEAIEAAVFLTIGQLWYSEMDFLEELFVYCRPQYRRSSNTKDLLTFSKTCSDELAIPLIIGVLSNHRTEAKVRLYEREFGKPAGAFFVRGRTTGHKDSSASFTVGGR
jgi:hypothetical protein